MYTFSFDEARKKVPESTLVFYPYQVTEWEIEYKPLPFMKLRTEKKQLISNLTKKETSFFEWNTDQFIPFSNEYSNQVLPKCYSEQELMEVGSHFLKNNYLHKRKVWSYPQLTLIHSYFLYIPYLIYQKKIKGVDKTVILEPFTGSEDLLDKYKEVRDYLNKQEVII
ncbi:hypothetical protein ACFSTA_01740 [Ornithinibacillus salinisoli]|uniref:Uncharacterized protein n=1 Tax=Ornithinibacillus salinisoli TaxID=1848459 RepID=A0ABW4VTT2_9BACI